MTDPERFSKQTPSPLARLLLRVGAEEKPSAAALRRTTSAVAAAMATGAAVKGASAATAVAGVKLATKGAVPVLAAGATTTTGGTAVPTGVTLGAAVIAKWFGMGLLGGAIALPLARAVSEPPATKHAQPLATLASNTVSEGSRRSAREAEVRSAPEAAPSDLPNELAAPSTVEAHRAQSSAPPAEEPGKAAAAARTDSPLLAAEVRFVDQGRAALQRGAFNDALELLAPYENRFGQQQLLTEVLFLRMEAFSRSGDSARARSLAARLVTRGVAGPQAARARKVLGR